MRILLCDASGQLGKKLTQIAPKTVPLIGANR